MATPAIKIKAIWPYQDLSEATSRPLVTPVPSRPTPVTASARGATPRRSIGLRAATSFPAIVCEGPHTAQCRVTELSASGVVIERGRELSEREERAIMKLELFLPEQPRPVRVLARVVRRRSASCYALRFMSISDVDRLTLMEHLDHEQLESEQLLEEIAESGTSWSKPEPT